jgi:hypothetical protein
MKNPLQAKATVLDEFVFDIDRLSDDRVVVVVVGPMLWPPRNNNDEGKCWYFTIAYKRPGEFYSMRIDTPDYAPPITIGDVPDAQACGHVLLLNFVSDRDQVIPALKAAKLTVHDIKDEIAQARLCERLWPSERTRRLRKAVETELAAR